MVGVGVGVANTAAADGGALEPSVIGTADVPGAAGAMVEVNIEPDTAFEAKPIAGASLGLTSLFGGSAVVDCTAKAAAPPGLNSAAAALNFDGMLAALALVPSEDGIFPSVGAVAGAPVILSVVAADSG
mmetsp:Transcript_33882/g.133032  ORF Transcript_33882/g.133032 Transcript_33882/m.133032 type:complete len:129 (+) Transcript_33882:2830-3216(+)